MSSLVLKRCAYATGTVRSPRFSFLISLWIRNGCLHSYLPFLCGFPWVYCLVYDFNYSKQLKRKQRENERKALRLAKGNAMRWFRSNVCLISIFIDIVWCLFRFSYLEICWMSFWLPYLWKRNVKLHCHFIFFKRAFHMDFARSHLFNKNIWLVSFIANKTFNAIVNGE